MGQKKQVTPEEVSADILIAMKEAAEKELGCSIH
jgi:molecular chaperone DnaK (HSP70)